MAKTCIFFLGVLAIVASAFAATPEEIAAVRGVIRPMVEDCAKEFGITTEKLQAAKQAKDVDALDACFYACFFKKVGFIDAAGKYDSALTIEKNKKYFKGEAAIQKIERIANTCASVNDEPVTDGDKGCERSKKLLSCFLKQNAEFTIYQY